MGRCAIPHASKRDKLSSLHIKDEEAAPTPKKLHCLQPPLHLAEEVEALLGGGEILLRAMPAVESKDSAEYGETVRGLFWFRNDLRLHDHPLLAEAASECDELLLLYIFDPRSDEDGTCGFSETLRAAKEFHD